MAVDDEVDRVIVVQSLWTRERIYKHLASCGRIYGFYPWKKPESSVIKHYFVRLRDARAVDEARRTLTTEKDFCIHVLKSNATLIPRYRAIIQLQNSVDDEKYLSKTLPRSPPRHPRPRDRARSPPSRPSRPRSSAAPTSSRAGLDTSPSETDAGAVSSGGEWAEKYASPSARQSGGHQATIDAMALFSRRDRPPLAISTRAPRYLHGEMDKDYEYDDLQSRTVLPPTPVSATTTVAPSKPTPREYPDTPSASLPRRESADHHIISLNYQGLPVEINLVSFMEKPDEIVYLLKASDADHTKWMMTAIHFRRRGFPRTARRVLLAMISELVSQHWEESDLKPVLLMLAGCERDCGKKAARERGPDCAEALQHHQNAIAVLQRVFVAKESEARAIPLPQLPVTMEKGTQGDSLSRSDCLTTPNSNTPSLLVMEAELRQLRENESAMKLTLESVRSAKRKAEEDHDYERQQRRRLERSLHETKLDLEKARRLEERSYDIAKVELVARKETEKLLEKEKRQWKDTARTLQTSLIQVINESFPATP